MIGLDQAVASRRPGPGVAMTYTLLVLANVAIWAWAIAAGYRTAQLLGVALVIYGLGLRHAMDADHIAAIDNVTRKLMQSGQPAHLAGLWFALGHSAIVTGVALAVVATASLLGTFRALQALGGSVSTFVSALFLLAIAAMNIVVFLRVWRCWRGVREGKALREADLDVLTSGRGLLSWLSKPLFRLVTRPWHMLALGVLFGLGFDTATEVAMYGMSASQVSRGLPLHAILVLPALFAAGMTLVDTSDSVLMSRAYRWALAHPVRRIFYNLSITGVSIAVALGVGGIELLDLLAARLSLSGTVWNAVSRAHANFNALGFAITGLFVFAWAVSWLACRLRGRGPVPGPIAGRTLPD